MSSRDPVERSRLATIAANKRWAFEQDRTAATQAARDAQQRKREDEVDPEHKLSPEERAKRANNLRLAQMQRIALKGSRAAARKRTAAAQRRNTQTVPASQGPCDTQSVPAGGDPNQAGGA